MMMYVNISCENLVFHGIFLGRKPMSSPTLLLTYFVCILRLTSYVLHVLRVTNKAEDFHFAYVKSCIETTNHCEL